jgi:hypothetical protein
MDLTDMLKKIVPNLSSLRDDDRAIVAPVIEHMHAGVIRPVSEIERSAIMRLSGGMQ